MIPQRIKIGTCYVLLVNKGMDWSITWMDQAEVSATEERREERREERLEKWQRQDAVER